MSPFVHGQEVSRIATQGLARAQVSPLFPEPEGHGKEPLWVACLTLTASRCYRHQRIATDRRPVVLTGPNGAGKTNVLEALSFLVPGRGLRGAAIADVARRQPGGGADLGASGASDGVAWAVAALGPNERRMIFVASMMAAEAVDQEYIAWVLGGAIPFDDSKYPYWQMLLSRADGIGEDIAPFHRPNGAACS